PWASEPDNEFLNRLRESIKLLQTETGKMIISRTYKSQFSSSLNPFHLYDIYSALEPNCAASHYANIGAHQYSVGCSPENIFELKDGTLFFDIIASTRGVSSDPEKNKRWHQELLEDEKENTEHMMAFNRYKARMQDLCIEGKYKVDFLKQVREFKHVKHLYSRLSGQLKQGVNLFQLLKDSYPPLNSYPENLILKADPRTEPFYFYGGMVGYAEAGFKNASCFLNIRAAMLKGTQAFTQGGVGVVKESQAELELLEVKNKLACLMEAFELWQGKKHAS
ncbi:MAG: chorismate-binding protein, partial [Cycloclasticus sp.]|nr:chorismate-binding protein [Cycloclasticus sp.]